jgi:glycosyltransferase involved in cell wall biosynthesis
MQVFDEMSKYGNPELTVVCPRMLPLFDSDLKASIGGAEVQLYLLIRALEVIRPDIKISVLVADYGQSAVVPVSKSIRMVKSINFKQSMFVQLVQFASAFLSTPRKTVLQRAMSPFTPLIWLWTKLSGGRFVYMIAHDTEVDGTHAFYSNRLVKWACESMLRSTDIVIAQNMYQRVACQRRFGRDFPLIRNGHRITEYSENVGRNVVLWVGRNDAQKQPWIFLELICSMPDTHFVMVCNRAGDLETADYADIKSRASRLPNCEFFESIAFEKIESLYSRARILVNTSTGEGFPNTFIQAALHSAPIVSLRADPDGVLSSFDMGRCTNGSTEMLRDEVCRYMTDDELCKKHGRNAYLYASKHHDITKQADELARLLYPVSV